MSNKQETMLNEPVIITGLDGKEYKVAALPFSDAFKLADKINIINTVPIVALMDPKQREVLLDIIVMVLKRDHPEITREKLKNEPIFDLTHIRTIVAVALDLNELKK